MVLNVKTMLEVSIRALKARLGEFVRRAANGETIVITERGRPAAELVRHGSTELPGRLAELVQRGEVTLATKPPRLPRVRGKMQPGSSLSDVVVEERRKERLVR
jgi:antitoxin (DNA-binding transcriptional repressor) of toxin-antitoxin stability system